MDKDRLTGSAANLGGKVKEGAGKLTGNAQLQSEGKLDQAKGKVERARRPQGRPQRQELSAQADPCGRSSRNRSVREVGRNRNEPGSDGA